MPLSAESIDTRITLLQHKTQQLVEILLDERAALSGRDLDALVRVTATKSALCSELAELIESSRPLPEAIAALPNPERAQLELRHKQLVALVASAQDSNLVNGKVIQRSQQSVLTILDTLSGKSLDGLYDTSGYSNADSNAKGRKGTAVRV